MHGGVATWGGIQTYGGCPNIRRAPHPHITCRYPLEHTDAQGSIGTYGVFEYMGESEHRGAYGHPLSVKHACL